MGTISCHSNQSSYPTGIKNTTYIEANVLSMYAKFRLHSPLWFLGRRFLNIFTKIDPFCRPDNQSNSPILTKVVQKVEDYSINISVKKKFQLSPTRQKKSWISSFPIISLWELEIAIATKVLIRLEQKTQLFVPPTYRCYM